MPVGIKINQFRQGLIIEKCSIYNYLDNQLHGLQHWLHPNGSTCLKENYLHGNLHGVSMCWYLDGSLGYEKKIYKVCYTIVNILKMPVS